VASGAAGELDALRHACDRAVNRLTAAALDEIIVLGPASVTASFGPDAVGTFARIGVAEIYPLAGGGGPATGGPALPISLSVGAWLLRRCPADPPRRALAVDAAATPDACAALGHDLAGTPGRVGLLVMGDGTAAHAEKLSGYAEPRADALDATVSAAFAAVDTVALAALDAGLTTELMMPGRAPWQVLAAAVAASGADGQVATGTAGSDPAPARWRGDMLYDDAPYGVTYRVAVWWR